MMSSSLSLWQTAVLLLATTASAVQFKPPQIPANLHISPAVYNPTQPKAGVFPPIAQIMSMVQQFQSAATQSHATATTNSTAQVTAKPTGASYVGTSGLPASMSTRIFGGMNHVSNPLPTNDPKLAINALSQQQTNGGSTFGTLQAPFVSQYTGDTANATNYPWGGMTPSSNNPYTSAPKTGVVRSYNFVISQGTLAPDGVQINMLLVNGQYPGPTIEADYGDTIQVTVTNNLNEGTSMHWHGLLQTGSEYEDGVPGVSQCPIAPGSTFTYSWTADIYGTSWYHAHYSAQYGAGLIGPVVIHGPANAQYDYDLGPVMLNDYYHTDYQTLVAGVVGTDMSKMMPASDNNLINGKGAFQCSLTNLPCTPYAGLSKFQVQSGKTYRMRLINAGANGVQKFSIDNQKLTVIANDFVEVNPYTTNIVTLGVGQRTDVIFTATNATGPAWIRSNVGCTSAVQNNGLAILYYNNATNASIPTTSAWPDSSDACGNDALSLTTPEFPMTPTSPATTQTIELSFMVNSTGNFLWTLGGQQYRADYNLPLLEQAMSGNTTFESGKNVMNFGTNSSIRLIVNNDSPVGHPMHIHGHNMYVLNEGYGRWDGHTLINAQNPNRRDVQLLRPGGYMVFQIDANNPGIWPFHCHIAWHASGGLYMNILYNEAAIQKIQLPAALTQVCQTWDAWTNGHVVDQVDSGLKKRGAAVEQERLHEKEEREEEMVKARILKKKATANGLWSQKAHKHY